MIGRYRELGTNREVCYVEQKGKSCEESAHRRNHTIPRSRLDLRNSAPARNAS
jgi:hypothetical protein